MHFTTAGYVSAIFLTAGIAVIGIPAPAADAADVIKIGAPLALTGPLADEGQEAGRRLEDVAGEGQRRRRASMSAARR